MSKSGTKIKSKYFALYKFYLINQSFLFFQSESGLWESMAAVFLNSDG